MDVNKAKNQREKQGKKKESEWKAREPIEKQIAN
jgi:hypothetical protein